MNLLLLAALLASCLVLVRSAYDTRKLFTAIDRARAEQSQLDAEFKRLDAERQAQATHLRVERVAREKLHMRTATPAVTQYVAADGAAASAAGSSPASSPASSSTPSSTSSPEGKP